MLPSFGGPTSLARLRSGDTLRADKCRLHPFGAGRPGTGSPPMRLKIMPAATALALAAPLGAEPADDFHALLDAHYQWLLRNNPTYATALGVRDYDDQLPDLSEESRQRQVAEARAFLARVDAIPADQLGEGDRVTRAILRRSLAEAIEADRFGQRDMLFTTYDGSHQHFGGLALDLPLANRP